MANSSYIIASDLTGPHASFGAQVGGLIQTFSPVTYYRTKSLIDDGTILEVSRLARRPKKATSTIAAHSGTIFDSILEARDEIAARTEAVDNPDQDAFDDMRTSGTRTDDDDEEDFSGKIDHVDRFISKLEFGPGRKGEKTARIIILLTLGLSPKDVLKVLQTWYPEFSSRGAILQRRRGLRIMGWEAGFCKKHGIMIPTDI